MGDSGILVLRPSKKGARGAWEVFYRSSTQLSKFNTPFQVWSLVGDSSGNCPGLPGQLDPGEGGGGGLLVCVLCLGHWVCKMPCCVHASVLSLQFGYSPETADKFQTPADADVTEVSLARGDVIIQATDGYVGRVLCFVFRVVPPFTLPSIRIADTACCFCCWGFGGAVEEAGLYTHVPGPASACVLCVCVVGCRLFDNLFDADIIAIVQAHLGTRAVDVPLADVDAAALSNALLEKVG